VVPVGLLFAMDDNFLMTVKKYELLATCLVALWEGSRVSLSISLHILFRGGATSIVFLTSFNANYKLQNCSLQLTPAAASERGCHTDQHYSFELAMSLTMRQ
jgi:hypothetical protein